jgi:hypothetical protein
MKEIKIKLGRKSTKNKTSKSLFRRLIASKRRTKHLLRKSLQVIVEEKWLFLFVLFFLLTGSCHERMPDTVFMLSIDILLILYIKVWIRSLTNEDDTRRSQDRDFSVGIEKFCPDAFPAIAPIIMASILLSNGSWHQRVDNAIGFSLFAILGVYITSLPLIVNKIYRAQLREKGDTFLSRVWALIFHKHSDEDIISWRDSLLPIVYFVSLVILTVMFGFSVLAIIPLTLTFVIFPFLLCPPVLDTLLNIIYRIMKGYYHYMELEEIESGFRIDLSRRKKNQHSDILLLYHFLLPMFLFSFASFVIYASNTNFAGEAEKIKVFLVGNSIFFVFLPLYAFIFFLSLTGFEWGKKKIGISALLRYLTFLTLVLSIMKIHKEFLWDISKNSALLYSFVLGVSCGFTLFRKHIIYEIEDYLSGPKFKKPLDYLEVIRKK